MTPSRLTPGCTAVITGAASGLGLEASRLAARRGLNLVLADVQPDALQAVAAELQAQGAQVLPFVLDVAQAAEVQALAAATLQRFGAPHLVFNNAGVAAGGLVWEHSAQDRGINLMGVVQGVSAFTPLMLAAAAADPACEGHIVNTASMVGLLNAPNMGICNVSKHAVVALSETLHQDLARIFHQGDARGAPWWDAWARDGRRQGPAALATSGVRPSACHGDVAGVERTCAEPNWIFDWKQRWPRKSSASSRPW